MSRKTTLAVTLGGQPQTVTFTLDALLARGENIDQVVVTYLSGSPRFTAAFQRLSEEFTGNQFQGKPCRLRAAPVRLKGKYLGDVCDPTEVEAVRQHFFDLLADLKSQGQRVHLGLSGGRRILALMALEATMQHLTPADRLWHIHTTPDLAEEDRGGRLMHTGDRYTVTLVPVSFVPWASYFPALRSLLQTSGEAVRASILNWLEPEEWDRCAQVWQSITLRQQDVLRALAGGLSRPQAAEKLYIAVTTIDTHQRAILDECTKHWNNDENHKFDAYFLRERFGPFLKGLDQV
jgi:CRISPR-associated protein Csx14